MQEGASVKRGAEGRDRRSVVVRPGVVLSIVILSCVAAGLTIYWLLRSMRL